ncbi:sigma factor [Streptosporangium sp. NPDC000396]|uniref:sigma factor n=1 Tax=Streptosporangium sp. NPDC000396 TaxID=3366185 RepID=UPI0036CC4CAA
MSAKTSQGDAELLAESRRGNAAAYGELYERHAPAARLLALRLVRSPAEAEEVVGETFTKILGLIRRGGGPQESFRPYLLTALRRTVHDRSRGEGPRAVAGEIGPPGQGVPFVDPALSGLERSPVARAFLSLPERWQLVLWHTGVEQARAAEVAPLLGLTVNGVAALAHMAREGLRQACLRAHLAEVPRQECRPVLAKMGAYMRRGLARQDSWVLDEHMDGCADCHTVFMELADVNQGLRVSVGPLIAGPALTGYLAALNRADPKVASGFSDERPGRWQRASRPRRQAVAAGAATAAVVLAAGLVLVSAEGPLIPPSESAGLGPKPVAVAPAPQPQDPPSSPGEARASDGLGAAAPGGSGSAVPGVPGAAASPVDRTTDLPPAARLVARIDALGALVRSRAGMVAVRLRNIGDGESEELVADVGLPDGVTLPAAVRRGRAVALVKPVGTVDGWACRAAAAGARCTRSPLEGGRATAIFLRVMVSATAAEGSALSLRVTGAGERITAGSRTGVRAAGAPARFATDGRVVTTAIGNTLLNCESAASAGAAARFRDGDRRDNDLWTMAPFDQDRDPSTTSSSAARLALPKGSRVVWAGLYWSASAPADGWIKFKAPGDERYTRVRATQVAERELPVGPGYQAFADVTRLMRDLRGTYWAADASLQPGVARHAGWSLVVIAADPRQPYSHAVVVDTATVVDRNHRSLRMPLDGLTSAAMPARVDLVAWEGDAGVKGDEVRLGGRLLRPDGGDRDPGNPFDGSATGAKDVDVTFGTDVDSFQVVLGQDPVLKVSTRWDVLLVGAAVVRVPVRS